MSRKKTKGTEQSEKARSWRERLLLSPQDLADYTGYSKEAVYQFERGKRSDGTKHSEWAWMRYQLCCAAVEHQIKTGRIFEW